MRCLTLLFSAGLIGAGQAMAQTVLVVAAYPAVDDIIKAATVAGAPADYIDYLRSRVVLDSDDDL